MREVGGRAFLDRYSRKGFPSDFFERALDPSYLLELSERNPEAGLALVQLARELAGEYFLGRYGKKLHQEFFERMLRPAHLLDLSERNPEAALTLAQVARELGGEPSLNLIAMLKVRNLARPRSAKSSFKLRNDQSEPYIYVRNLLLGAGAAVMLNECRHNTVISE